MRDTPRAMTGAASCAVDAMAAQALVREAAADRGRRRVTRKMGVVCAPKDLRGAEVSSSVRRGVWVG
ncbi:Hypothetical protein A7982_11243 [Minicystis rosea]|nr:Hypothetical protein A7982_11243 [Minicystis rosea]